MVEMVDLYHSVFLSQVSKWKKIHGDKNESQGKKIGSEEKDEPKATKELKHKIKPNKHPKDRFNKKKVETNEIERTHKKEKPPMWSSEERHFDWDEWNHDSDFDDDFSFEVGYDKEDDDDDYVIIKPISVNSGQHFDSYSWSEESWEDPKSDKPHSSESRESKEEPGSESHESKENPGKF